MAWTMDNTIVATCLLPIRRGQKFKYQGKVWAITGSNEEKIFSSNEVDCTSLEFPLSAFPEAVLAGYIQFIE